MFGLDIPALALVLAAALLGYVVFGFGGFGAGIVALPLMAHVLPLRSAVPLMLVLDLCLASTHGWKNRHLVQRQEVKRLIPWLAIGMGFGVLTLAQAQERVLMLLLGGFVFVMATWSLIGRARGEPVATGWSVPAGLVGGVFSALFGTGGPVYTLYLARRIFDTTRLRASLGTLIFGLALARLVLLAIGGLFATLQPLALALLALPAAVLGYAIGTRLQQRLPQAQVRRGIWMLLIASGLSLLWRGVR